MDLVRSYFFEKILEIVGVSRHVSRNIVSLRLVRTKNLRRLPKCINPCVLGFGKRRSNVYKKTT